jgi:hypothetical protein
MNLKILKISKMKKITHVTCSIVFLLIGFVVKGQGFGSTKEYAFSKNKLYEKSYSIKSSDKIKIDNKFGFVKFSTWDKSEIKVIVEIKISGDLEKAVNETLENFYIKDSFENGIVSFKTASKGILSINTNSKKSVRRIETNFTVFLPINNALEVVNEFGQVSIGDYKGSIDIVSKFGSLDAGDLYDVKNILVEFGKAKISSLNNANATFNFSKVEINNLKGDNNLKFESCNSSKIILTNDCTKLSIEESNSTLNLNPVQDFNGNYSINTSSGKLINHSDLQLKNTEDEESGYALNFNLNYFGQSGNGACKIKIKSIFGKIILGEATEKEMKPFND